MSKSLANVIRTRRRRLLRAVLTTIVVLASAVPAARAGHDSFCYIVGDYTHALFRVNKYDFNPDTNETFIGSIETHKTDSITLQPGTGTLFAVNTHMTDREGHLGTLDPVSGSFAARGSSFGTGDGALGDVTFYDISGMSFDPATGSLYAVHIRTGSGASDALFQVDPNTGQHIPNAFGSGKDYVRVGPLGSLSDVDDIAFDPTDGQLYGIINNSANGDHLIRIDKSDGEITDVGQFGVGEVEGLSFDTHGLLWATAGGDPPGSEDNKLYEVDKATGQAGNPRPLDDGGNYEAIACLLDGRIEGTFRHYVPLVTR